MSDPAAKVSWVQTARRLAVEFDERLGSPADEIIAFEAPDRAIAVGITLPQAHRGELGACRFAVSVATLMNESLGSGELASDSRAQGCAWIREFVTIERVIVLGEMRCLNLVHLLRGASGQRYTLHGISPEDSAAALRFDMGAIVLRFAA